MESIELFEFVEKTLKDLEKAADTRVFNGGIEFEVAVSKAEKIDGKLNVYVAGAKGSSENQSVGKIRFTIHPHLPRSRSATIIPTDF